MPTFIARCWVELRATSIEKDEARQNKKDIHESMSREGETELTI